MLLTKDFGKFKVLDTTKITPPKKATRNLVRKSLGNITHFLNIRRRQPEQGSHQVSINKIGLTILCDLTVFSKPSTGPPELGGATGTQPHSLLF